MNIFKSAETAIENLLSDFRLIGDRVQQMAAAADKNNTLVLDALEEHEQRFKALESAGSDQSAPEPESPPSVVDTPSTEKRAEGLVSAPIEMISADSGETANINKGASIYPSGWYVDGDDVELDVDLYDNVRLDVISLLMHNPSDSPRLYFVNLGGNLFEPVESQADDEPDTIRYEARLPTLVTDGFTLTFGGNTLAEHNWNGVYRVEVYTASELEVRAAEKVDVELPANAFDQWPMQAKGADFRTTYNALSGFHLMKAGPSYADNFRFEFGHDGRSIDIASQADFDAARDNGDIGVLTWTGKGAAVLFDRRRSHSSIQLLVCDTLSHVRTWGNLAIDCQRVSRPEGSGYNVVAHGGNVLKSMPKGLIAENNDWGDIAIEAPSDAPFGNIVSQGGTDHNQYGQGRETVEFARGAWQSNWQSHWDKGMSRPFPMTTYNTGTQGRVVINPCDGDQSTAMPSWLDPAKSNHPHGRITHHDTFTVGIVSGITPDKYLIGYGENLKDDKAALGILVDHCIAAGFAQNRYGQNGSNGTGLLGTHFWCNKAVVSRSVSHSQRAAEFGCGDDNLVNECFVGDPNYLNDLAAEMGKKPAGAFGIVAYKEHRYPWIEEGQQTQVRERGNVYNHTPRHAMNDGLNLDSEGMIIVSKGRDVFADFGPLGMLAIGTTDPKAKGSIWYAG